MWVSNDIKRCSLGTIYGWLVLIRHGHSLESQLPMWLSRVLLFGKNVSDLAWIRTFDPTDHNLWLNMCLTSWFNQLRVGSKPAPASCRTHALSVASALHSPHFSFRYTAFVTDVDVWGMWKLRWEEMKQEY